MTPKNTADPEGDDSLGMLDDTASSDTGIGLLGGTAHVSVSLPAGDEDDDLVDDEVVGGEIVSELVIDTSAVADAETVARMQQEAPEIVIELPAEPEEDAAAQPEEDAPEEPAADPTEELVEPEEDAQPVDEAPSADPVSNPVSHPAASPAVPQETRAAEPRPDAEEPADGGSATEPPAQPAVPPAPIAAEEPHDEEPGSPGVPASAPDVQTRPDPSTAESTAPEPDSTGILVDAAGLSKLESVVAAAKAELREAMSPDRPAAPRSSRPTPAEQPERDRPVANDLPPAERPAPQERPAPALSSKRLDELEDSGRESADLLTPDRLLDPSRMTKPEPEGAWSHFLYSISGGRINIGDGRKARARKELTARIAAPMSGNARFVPVLSRKGGVGKTTVTALLGMALADARDDRVIAVDANPDRGTLAERVVGSHSRSVRDLVRAQHDIRGFHDISAIVARDETRLDVIASDMDPRVSEAFGDADYRDVAAVAAQYYSLVLTDSGTGIVHSVMGATLDLADQIVIVSGLSVDEARLASETLTWLESNGRADLAREAVVVLNQSTPGAPLVRLGELEAHFSTRAAHVLRIPYDPQIAGGGPIDYAGLQPETRQAARRVAAVLVESLRAKAGR